MNQKSKFEGRVNKIRKAADKRSKRRAKAFKGMSPEAWSEYVEWNVKESIDG